MASDETLFFLCTQEIIINNYDTSSLPPSIRHDMDKWKKEQHYCIGLGSTWYEKGGKRFGPEISMLDGVHGKIETTYNKKGKPTRYVREDKESKRVYIQKGNNVVAVTRSSYGYAIGVFRKSLMEFIDTEGSCPRYYAQDSFLLMLPHEIAYRMNGIFREIYKGTLVKYATDDEYREYNIHGQLIKDISRIPGGRMRIIYYRHDSTKEYDIVVPVQNGLRGKDLDWEAIHHI